MASGAPMTMETVDWITTIMLWVVVPNMVIWFLAGVKGEGIKEAFKTTLLIGGVVFVGGWVFWALVVVAVGTRSSAATTHTFGGYECTDNCSGHKAGYKWAEAKGVSDEEQCEGILVTAPNRTSFYQGCKVYVEDPSRGADEDDDGDEIPAK